MFLININLAQRLRLWGARLSFVKFRDKNIYLKLTLNIHLHKVSLPLNHYKLSNVAYSVKLKIRYGTVMEFEKTAESL
jgi:hypothetical protein